MSGGSRRAPFDGAQDGRPPRERRSVGSVDDLHESATKITGLDDFADSEYLEPLQVLLYSYEHSAGPTGVGNTMVRSFLRGALAARLMSQAGFAKHPEHAKAPAERPIFVTGIQRSGTTMMQRLLHADPSAQGLEMWLTQLPQPRPPRDTWDDGGVPGARARPGVHRLAATPDWVPAYERYRRNLPLIGLGNPGQRWVLKNPSHMDALDALMTVFPDALVVRTHRVGSACSLAATTTRGWSEVFEGERLGRDAPSVGCTTPSGCPGTTPSRTP